MELFNTLMMIFIGLLLVNVIITFSLWRSTRSVLFGVLTLHWVFTMLSFYVQKHLATSYIPVVHALGIIPTNFAVHFCLCWVYANMMELSFKLKNFLFIPAIAISGALLFHFMNAPVIFMFLSLSFSNSLFYFIVVFRALKNKRHKMTFSQQLISFLMVVFGLHLYTYAFFQSDLRLLTYGFAVALGLLMSISILFPAAIIERLSQEYAKLLNEIELKAKLTHSAKMVALGEMAEGIAHEINNPLMILSLMLDKARLSVHEKDISTLENQIERCHKSAKRVSKIVKGLLDFSSERDNQEFILINGQKLIEDTLELCLEKIKKYHIKLEVIEPDNPIDFIGQRVQLSHVLLNLINNAFDACQFAETKWIRIELSESAESVVFAVTDSGPGFTEEAKIKLFQPFFTTKEVGKGTGLGLSISHGIIERHKGLLAIDYQSPQTRIFFSIPKTIKN